MKGDYNLSKLTGPRLKTIKRLFAVSGNKCAFSNCNNTLVSEEGKVTGRICHIKAQKAGGPRYDQLQGDEDRHGFDNLIIMCPIHHDVIDSDEISYTVERLTEIKKQHENNSENMEDCSDEVANTLLLNMTIENKVNLIYEFNNNGQLGHVIINNQYITIPDKSIKVSARMLLLTVNSILEELGERNKYRHINMSQVETLIDYKDHYERISDYLNMEDSTKILDFFNKLNLFNRQLIAIEDYFRVNKLPHNMPIFDAGLRQLEKPYFNYMDIILKMDIGNLCNQLTILAEMNE